MARKGSTLSRTDSWSSRRNAGLWRSTIRLEKVAPTRSGPQKRRSRKENRRTRRGRRRETFQIRLRVSSTVEKSRRVVAKKATTPKPWMVSAWSRNSADLVHHALLGVGEDLDEDLQAPLRVLAEDPRADEGEGGEQRDQREDGDEGEGRGGEEDRSPRRPGARSGGSSGRACRRARDRRRRGGSRPATVASPDVSTSTKAPVSPVSGSCGRGQPSSSAMAAASALRGGSSPWFRKIRCGRPGQGLAPAQQLVPVGVGREALELVDLRRAPGPSGRGWRRSRRRRPGPARGCPRAW